MARKDVVLRVYANVANALHRAMNELGNMPIREMSQGGEEASEGQLLYSAISDARDKAFQLVVEHTPPKEDEA